jgi:hypothetical protein
MASIKETGNALNHAGHDHEPTGLQDLKNIVLRAIA